MKIPFLSWIDSIVMGILPHTSLTPAHTHTYINLLIDLKCNRLFKKDCLLGCSTAYFKMLDMFQLTLCNGKGGGHETHLLLLVVGLPSSQIIWGLLLRWVMALRSTILVTLSLKFLELILYFSFKVWLELLWKEMNF